KLTRAFLLRWTCQHFTLRSRFVDSVPFRWPSRERFHSSRNIPLAAKNETFTPGGMNLLKNVSLFTAGSMNSQNVPHVTPSLSHGDAFQFGNVWHRERTMLCL